VSKIKFTETSVRKAPGPDDGKDYVIHHDSELRGLGLRVTKNGARAWVLNYRARGLSRRMTIGDADAWPLALAREEARRLRRLVDLGQDPLEQREAQRAAPTVADLVERWREDVAPKKRERSRGEDGSLIRQWLIPELGKELVAEVRRADVEKLHNKITKYGAPVRANRAIAMLSRLFNLAIRWEMRADNPAQGIERNQETRRHRYLDIDELGRLLIALSEHRNQQAADIIRLLLLTGARRSEVLNMEWNQLDLAPETATWSKPAAMTKQRQLHHVPLSGPALQLLQTIKAEAEAQAMRRGREISRWVFPANGRLDKPIGDVKHSWATICRKAGIEDLHLHDLRHSYASLVASYSSANLPIIGQLLGHTQASTTARYTHLLVDPLREVTERVGALIAAVEAGKTGEIVPLRRPRRPGGAV
jgi:integrase